MLKYFWLIPLFPAFGALVNGLFGISFFKKKRWVNIFAVGTPFLSFILSSIATLELLKLPAGNRLVKAILFEWVPGGIAVLRDGSSVPFSINLSFQFDPLSAVMALVVSGVGFLIHVYSIGYMGKDPGYARYFTYLNLFTFSMLLLVLSSNLALMFVGWEGVGLCSYLLIGFWYHKDSAANAGKKAFIVNRVGDFGFLLGILFTFFTVGSLEFTSINEYIKGGHLSTSLATVIGLLLFVGAVGKSAQLPLYVWLPDAMEGPTPVSALIHAATMVTAGVYMVSRMNLLYSLSEIASGVVAVIGGITAIYSASMGLVQNDIKRILAYSTISQIGYMMLGCGSGSYSSGMFHLTTHAFFKALLFLSAGSVIHALSDEMDIRKMGGLRKYLPVTFPVFLIGALAISGIPGLSGFFSKDEILLSAYLSGRKWIWIIGVITAGMTAFYMFRLIFLVFYGKERMDEEVKHHIHESPKVMTIPLIILAGLSVIGGYIGLPEAMGGRNWFRSFLSSVIEEESHPISHSTEYLLMGISVISALIGIYIAWLFYIKNPELPEKLAEKFKALYTLLYRKYYVDEIYDFLFVKPTLKGSEGLWKGIDLSTIDGIAHASAKGANAGGSILARIQTGLVKDYGFLFLLGTIIILGYWLWKL
jgi:NADH-quinone oxidoreductase subunit L